MRERELTHVTAFVLRPRPREVLLARHAFGGIQFPAGAVELGEAPEAAATRVAADETALDALGAPRPAGVSVEEVVGAGWLVAQTTPVFLRPDARSGSWAILRRGISVISEREQDGFVQVTYEEVDRLPSPQYLSARITGWVPREALARVRRRFFFMLPCEGATLGGVDARRRRRGPRFVLGLDRTPACDHAPAGPVDPLPHRRHRRIPAAGGDHGQDGGLTARDTPAGLAPAAGALKFERGDRRGYAEFAEIPRRSANSA